MRMRCKEHVPMQKQATSFVRVVLVQKLVSTNCNIANSLTVFVSCLSNLFGNLAILIRCSSLSPMALLCQLYQAPAQGMVKVESANCCPKVQSKLNNKCHTSFIFILGLQLGN